MGKNKKKFIDKKKAATFSLLYRESADGEELSAERVYTRVDNNQGVAIPGFEDGDGDLDSRFDDAEEDEEGFEELEPGPPRPKSEVQYPLQQQEMQERVRGELLEMGFPDDGYNYMKHMRTLGAGGGTVFVPTTHQQATLLPVDVKAYDASKVRVEEEQEDDSNKFISKGTKVRQMQTRTGGLDSEVAALLAESDISDEEETGDLEDDFILIANQGVEAECSTEARGIVPASTEGRKTFSSEPADSDDEEDNRSVATMTVSEERTFRLLDEQFEVLALKEYDDESDEEDPRARGHADISQFASILDEFLASNNPTNKHTAASTKHITLPEVKEVVNEEAAVEGSSGSEEEEEEELEAVWIDESDEDTRDKWDCETIVSTMSNLENHPSRIPTPSRSKRVQFASLLQSQELKETIRIGGKQKLPLDFVRKLASNNTDQKRGTSIIEAQKKAGPRGETPEERKARKLALKEDRRASRKAKKELRTQFRTESVKAQSGAAVVTPRAIHLS